MENNHKSWVISVNMGYGHQRTAYPLLDFAFAAFDKLSEASLAPLGREGKIINANDYEGIPEKDRQIWESSRKFYEFISKFKRIPLIGNIAFSIFDEFQKILSFYPKRDLSRSNLSLKRIYSLIERGWGRDLIQKISQPQNGGKKYPSLITTFFIPAFMAEFFRYPGEIFCVICDADIARTWAPLEPQKSKIKYFVPNSRVADRLKMYGVKERNIFLSGYPLPKENIGTEKMEILKDDLRQRILNLDPKKEYFRKYSQLIKIHLGELPEKPDRPLTIMFSVGGAGAQKEIAIKILKCLIRQIKQKEIKLILSAGIKKSVRDYFLENIKKLKLEECLGKSIEIIFGAAIEEYFRIFNEKLRKTDILWTKPSELSFYSALGLPIIIAPTIGSQEEFNKRWLLKSGFGNLQENPNYTNQWLFDWLENGYLAECAMEGFIEGEKLGVYNIEKIYFEN